MNYFLNICNEYKYIGKNIGATEKNWTQSVVKNKYGQGN